MTVESVGKCSVVLLILLPFVVGIRINFTSCQNAGWKCANNLPNEIIYTCSSDTSDYVIHLKDYYTDHITSLTVQQCKKIKIILDCSILQRPSRLQAFRVNSCATVEFGSLASNSLLQTPPEVTIDNVQEIISLPRGMFKSPVTNTELKCLGTTSLSKIRIANSKIKLINTKAIYNVTGIRNIEFENVTINDAEIQAIEANMGFSLTAFTITNSKIDNLRSKAIAVQSRTVTMSNTVFGDIPTKSVNISSDFLHFTDNSIKDVFSDGFIFKSVYTYISRNHIRSLKGNALASVRCSKKMTNGKQFSFSKNSIENIGSGSLYFDYQSCKSAGTIVNYKDNQIDCKCHNIAFLVSSNVNQELNNLILDTPANNTCLAAPCSLPVDIIRMLMESNMCQINLDPRVMCLLYNDKKSKNNEVNTEEDVTEAAPTFYLIRQANGPNGDPSAAMTAINKDDLLNDSHLNMTNRTTIKVVFDSSKDFVETLRSTSNSRKRPVEEPKSPPKTEYTNRCVGTQCRTNAYDKQKALDFYKYVYAQLRPPKIDKT
ncbi:uncharacterized protein [Choristoneura fumiferana]|uniref:uncharacterized protein n=1 Tax=Choristoneura fumiferana TaxID=7141 RepID=UPI003D15BF5F